MLTSWGFFRFSPSYIYTNRTKIIRVVPDSELKFSRISVISFLFILLL